MDFERLMPKKLKKILQTKRQKGIALDIDDTLSYTDHHWIEQMKVSFGNPENLSRDEIVAKYKWIEAVPYWSTKKAQATLNRFMHSNAFQETIPLIEDSNHVARKINELIPIIAYITARPISVFDGTKKWLVKHGFPAAPIIFRPLSTAHKQKNSWKAKLLKFLYPEVLGIIDDNPDLADELASIKYPGFICLYDSRKNTKHYDVSVFRCQNWQDIFNFVKEKIYAKSDNF